MEDVAAGQRVERQKYHVLPSSNMEQVFKHNNESRAVRRRKLDEVAVLALLCISACHKHVVT